MQQSTSWESHNGHSAGEYIICIVEELKVPLFPWLSVVTNDVSKHYLSFRHSSNGSLVWSAKYTALYPHTPTVRLRAMPLESCKLNCVPRGYDTRCSFFGYNHDQGWRFIYTSLDTDTKCKRSFISQCYPNENLNYTNQRTYKTVKNQRGSFDETHGYEVL